MKSPGVSIKFARKSLGVHHKVKNLDGLNNKHRIVGPKARGR